MDKDTLIAIVKQRWGLTVEVEKDLSELGYSGSSIFRVREGDRVLLLKAIPASAHSPSHVYFAHRVVDFLSTNDFRYIPHFLTDIEGKTLVDTGDLLVELTEFIDGTSNVDYTHTEIRQAAEAIAEWHKLLKNLPEEATDRVDRPIDDIISLQRFEKLSSAVVEGRELFELHGVDEELSEFMQLAEEAWMQKVNPIDWSSKMDGIQRSVLHKDLFRQNLLFTIDQAYLIDYGNAMRGRCLDDLTRLVVEICDYKVELAQELLSSYHAAMPLTETEKTLFIPWCNFAAVRLASWYIREAVKLQNMFENKPVTVAQAIRAGIDNLKFIAELEKGLQLP